MKNSINFLLTFCVTFAVVMIYGCSKDKGLALDNHNINQAHETSTQMRTQFSGITAARIVLGAKRNNPFEIGKINVALDCLYIAPMSNKMATHKYIKFIPSTQSHIDILEDWETDTEIPLFDFPLEYEIISEGETFVEPSVSDSIYTHQYASVPVSVSLPTVPFQLIENLYLDMSDPLLIAESFFQTGNMGDINEYVFHGGLTPQELSIYDETDIHARIPIEPDEDCPPGFRWKLITTYENNDPTTGKKILTWECVPEDPPPPPSLNECGCPIPNNRRYPAGCIMVDFNSDNVPVQNIMVKVKDHWFKSGITFTTSSGCWTINNEHAGKVKIILKFKNRNVKARDLGYRSSLQALRDNVGTWDGPPYNNILIEYDNGLTHNNNNSRERQYWAAAHGLNTVNEYRTIAANDGIPLPRKDLNWTSSSLGGAGAAPMLQWNPYNSWLSYLIQYIPIANVIYNLTLPHHPDIYNPYDIDDDAVDYTGTGFHELGHASHHSLVGESYWIPYRHHVIANSGYGEFGNFAANSDPGRVALGEAVGNFVGATYGQTPDGGENNEWDTRDNFIPQGLLWDLNDSNVDIVTDPNNPANTGPDNISGFTRSMLFNGLTPNVIDIRSYRNRLRVLHLGDTPNNVTDYNNFVDVYDVFN